MKLAYWPCLLAGTGFLIWVHTHTDEIPVVLGFVLIAGCILGAAFPRNFPFSALVLGSALFCAETLVHLSILRAPYPPSAGLPWVALVGYIPAIFGLGLGAGLRRLAR